jgi:DNA-binding transcriptional regulator GbsR (MarR family)
MEQQKVKEQVERIGIVCDKDGMPPLAGRMVGFFMLAEPPHKTFEELVEFLQASKSAISTTLRFLEGQGMVEYITFPGDRKRYFRLSVENWDRVILSKMDFLKAMQMRVSEVIASRSDKYPEFNNGLKAMYALYDIFLESMPKLIQLWQEKVKELQTEK